MAKLSIQFPEDPEARIGPVARIIRLTWTALCWTLAFGSVLVICGLLNR
jgi:hypothetical protein